MTVKLTILIIIPRFDVKTFNSILFTVRIC